MTTITKEQAQEIIDAADEVITALAGTNEDVHPDNSQEMIRLYDDLNDHYAPPEVVRELARIALASLDAEPVAYTDAEELRFPHATSDMWPAPLGHGMDLPLYIAPPAPVSVPDNSAITQHFDTIALETAREIMCDVNRRHEFLGGDVQLLSRIQCRIDDACRAAMLQGGKS